MKHWKIKFISITALLTGIAFAANCGWGKHHSFEKRAEWVVKKITSDLDLTDKQAQELNRIKEEVLKKKTDLQITHKIPDAMIDQIKGEKIDQKAANAYFDEHIGKRNQMRTFMIAKFAEFHAILTPEQREKLAKRVHQFHEKFEKHLD